MAQVLTERTQLASASTAKIVNVVRGFCRLAPPDVSDGGILKTVETRNWLSCLRPLALGSGSAT